MTRRPTVLSLLGCYVPGTDASGPIQSFRAFATGLRSEMDIRVVSGSQSSASPWYDDGFAIVHHMRRGWAMAWRLRRLLHQTPHDVLMLNGFYDREFTIPVLVLRHLGLIPRVPTILSLRGEFAEGALSLKPARKRVWLCLVHAFGLTRNIWLHATARHEHDDIARQGLPSHGILDAPDTWMLAARHSDAPETASPPLRLAFVGRVSPVKNLHFALDVLSQVSAPVCYDIFGPADDNAYRALLEERIARLPPHVTVQLMGELRHDAVAPTLAGYHLFLFPTMGENFGHAIAEALAQGVPVLIADTTPWRSLKSSGAGWDLPLSEPEHFTTTIDRVATMPPAEHQAMRDAARALAERSFTESEGLAASRAMIATALASTA